MNVLSCNICISRARGWGRRNWKPQRLESDWEERIIVRRKNMRRRETAMNNGKEEGLFFSKCRNIDKPRGKIANSMLDPRLD